MPAKTEERLRSIKTVRHSEYYGMQEIYDDLYAESKSGKLFPVLMDKILSRENILLAYRNIKANAGSYTPGTDNLTIKDIAKLAPDEVVHKVRLIVNSAWGYRPRAVRRKEIPKPNGSLRPLGIPCIWDRLIQQCIKQVMEPICEAKFSDNSHGFRPLRSVEHAIARAYKLMQRAGLHYCIEFDIKSFFDEVDHSKLIRQIWSLGIQDKHLIYVLKQILTAPIKMPDGKTVHPTKGTPQGGIISPLLANIVLNELDHWVEGQWQTHPMTEKFDHYNDNGSRNNRYAYKLMRKTQLKEMYIVRYADDFRIFCRTKSEANKILIAVTQWIEKRLRLQVSPEKTRVVNLKRRYSEFLGFKMKVHKKSKKYVVKSHIADKNLKRVRDALVEQAKNIAKPRSPRKEIQEIRLYNSMVEGIQNYYRVATNVNIDCASLKNAVRKVLENRLNTQGGKRLVRKGRTLTAHEQSRYGKSAMIRYVAGSYEPIYPVGYIQHKNPMSRKRTVQVYSAEGRSNIHDNLRINTKLMHEFMRHPVAGKSIEYVDNCISSFSAQWGKCAVTNKDFKTLDDICGHHIIPIENGGTDRYQNIVLVAHLVHEVIHAKEANIIQDCLTTLKLSRTAKKKVNTLREKAGYALI